MIVFRKFRYWIIFTLLLSMRENKQEGISQRAVDEGVKKITPGLLDLYNKKKR